MATVAEALAQARLSYRAGDFQKAATVAMQILQADACQVEALDLLGGICLAQGRLAEAAGCYRRVLQLRPDDSSHTSLGIVLFRLGQLDQALPHFREALRRTPDSPAAHNNLGLILKDLGHAGQAESCFRAALRLQPNLAEAHSNLGLALKTQGKLDEALACLQRALHLKPDSPEVHNNLGLVHKDMERLEEASACYREATRLRPGYAEAHSNLGNALRELGRLEEAAASLGVALHLNPSSAETLSNLGLVLKEQGKRDEALDALRQALRLQPGSARIHSNLGLVLQEQGQRDEALACLQEALRLQPGLPELHNNLGLALLEQGRAEEAVASYREAVRLRPGSAEAHCNLGNALRELGRLDEAAACLSVALQLNSGYAEAHANLGVVLKEQGKLDEDLACLRQAVHLKPGEGLIHSNLGVVLMELGHLQEGETTLRQAARLKPGSAQVLSNLGVSLLELGQLQEAEASLRQAVRVTPGQDYTDLNRVVGIQLETGQLGEAETSLRQALRLKPGCPEAQHALATLALLQGDFEHGAFGFEARWHIKEGQKTRRSFRQPWWDGSSLVGRTILLWAEQGLGDTLQFIRYAALVKQRGGTVLVEAQPALVPLLSRCPEIDRLLARGDSLPDFDVQAPLLSLPRIFGTTLASVPAEVPYLFAEPERLERWRRELAPLTGLKIGINWQGNPGYRLDRYRSFPLAHYEALAHLEGIHLLSLQKGAGFEQLADFALRWPITDLGSRLDTTGGVFLDTAAVLLHLDLVITSDTALAHLAGALGVPVWVALGFVPDWRWLLERPDCPWYPTMRLFRQERPGDWPGVFQRIAAALAGRQEASRPTAPRCRPIRVEIAAGELIDKITILQIKSRRLTDAVQRGHVQTELEGLQSVCSEVVVPTAALEALTAELRTVNETLWQIEDDIRLCERDQDFGPRFIALARAVYQHNDRRAALKRQINDLLGSRLIEEKTYAASGSLPPDAPSTSTAGTESGDWK